MRWIGRMRGRRGLSLRVSPGGVRAWYLLYMKGKHRLDA